MSWRGHSHNALSGKPGAIHPQPDRHLLDGRERPDDHPHKPALDQAHRAQGREGEATDHGRLGPPGAEFENDPYEGHQGDHNRQPGQLEAAGQRMDGGHGTKGNPCPIFPP